MASALTPGEEMEHSAYRSELFGLTAISLCLRILACGLQQPRHTIIGCDGQAALQVLNTCKEEVNANSQHADLKSLVVTVWSSTNVTPLTVHIKGHQEEHTHHLNRMEKMNIMMDKLATMTAKVPLPHRYKAPVLPEVGIRRVEYKNRTIRGNLQKTLYNALVGDQLKNYYDSKLFSTPGTVNTIDFHAFKHARAQTSVGINKFVTKWVSNTLATGVILQNRNHRIFNRCPRCNEWGEDRLHIIICWDIRAKIIWEKGYNTLQQLLQKLHTNPEITL
jgi:hypothetical protein